MQSIHSRAGEFPCDRKAPSFRWGHSSGTGSQTFKLFLQFPLDSGVPDQHGKYPGESIENNTAWTACVFPVLPSDGHGVGQVAGKYYKYDFAFSFETEYKLRWTKVSLFITNTNTFRVNVVVLSIL